MNLAALGPPPRPGISSATPHDPVVPFEDLWHRNLATSTSPVTNTLPVNATASVTEPFVVVSHMRQATAEPFQDLWQLRLANIQTPDNRAAGKGDVILTPGPFRDLWHMRLTALSDDTPGPGRNGGGRADSEAADTLADDGWLGAYRLATASAPVRADDTAVQFEQPVAFTAAAEDRGRVGDYRALMNESDLALAALFGLNVKTIMIDPGHGGRDPGAVGHSGLKEKDITLDIARRLQVRLAQRGNFRTVLTRNGDTKMSLRQRVEYANAHDVDLFISIHVNYLPVEPPTVIETYYFGAHEDTTALALAEKENRDSDYTMGDFKPMIQKLGDTFKYQESRTLALSIQQSLYRNMRRHNEKIIDVGIKTAPFVVLLGVEMPSVLAEVTCLSNKQEEQRLATAEYRDNIARYLEQGIVAYLVSRARGSLQFSKARSPQALGGRAQD